MATSKKRKKEKPMPAMSRHLKALFLPMDQSSVNQISLQFRLALETIRHGAGNRASAHCLAQVTLLTGFLTQAGHGLLEIKFLDSVERQVSDLLDHGRDSGEWLFPQPLVEALTVIVNEHDRQLRETRLQAIVEASRRLDKLIRSSPAKQRLAGFDS
ncbi:Fis family transcriptional regulator [Caballeronia sp. LjRoot31]|uniref:Fis family transcriptional regulator n=1 Tax=Caballeronia sp. LjRoot31 TaxID=3342324 RepID=UPI003ECE7E39